VDAVQCFLTAVQFVKLQKQAEHLIEPVEDSVRISVLDPGWVKRTITYGSQQPREERAIVF
jgi:CRISPR-associated protein Cas2